MGKRIITQRRGRGTSRYKSPSHRFKNTLSFPKLHDSKIGKITDIIHDRARSAPLAKVKFSDETILIPAALEMKTGGLIYYNKKEIQTGSVLNLSNIPTGSNIYNIENLPGSIGKYCRSSGTTAKIISKTDKYVTIQFPSKKKKNLHPNCRAIIGTVAGSGRLDKPVVKAGTKHHLMKTRNKLFPKVSGVAMNAVAHPFGSGRGRHMGKSQVPKKNSPPGRNVGLIRARRTGRK
jgi:large subunit ribosomal protein L2